MDICFTNDEMRFFKRNGFVIKPNLLKPELIAKAHEVFWERVPAQLKRDDPETWIGPFRDEYHIDDGTDLIRGHTWKFRAVGEDEWMMDLIPRNANLYGLAEQLLGKGNLVPPSGVRGMYTTLPQESHEAVENRLHVDQHIFHLGTVSYLAKVVTGGGGFRVWPGSHLWFGNIFEAMYKDGPGNRYQEAKAFFETQPSLECTGNAGDVVFWHHRLAHMAGQNISRNLRMAILYDFKVLNFDYTHEEPPKPDMWQAWPGLHDLG